MRGADDVFLRAARVLVKMDDESGPKSIRGLWGPHRAKLATCHDELLEAARALDALSVPALLDSPHGAYTGSVRDLARAVGLLRESLRTNSTKTYGQAVSAVAEAARRHRSATGLFKELAQSLR